MKTVTEKDLTNWQQTFPELQGRQRLLAELATNRGFRRKIFHIFNNVGEITEIRNPRLARYALQKYMEDVWERLVWDETTVTKMFDRVAKEGEDPEEDRELTRETLGAVKNLFSNMQIRLRGDGLESTQAATSKNKHYVRRQVTQRWSDNSGNISSPWCGRVPSDYEIARAKRLAAQ